MFHEDMLYIFYRKYIKTSFLISNMHCFGLHLDNFKGDFVVHGHIFEWKVNMKHSMTL